MELYIPPERPQRNLLNGRFLKGCTPHNKGKEMKFHSDKTKQRCINNLLKGRGGCRDESEKRGFNKRREVAWGIPVDTRSQRGDRC